MTQYREILRLHSMNLSQMNIAASCGVSKKTVNKVLKAASEYGISWPLDDAMTDAVLEERLFPKRPKIKTKYKKNDPANWETSSLDGEYVYIKAKYTGSVKYVTSQNLKAADIESTFAGLKVYLDNAQLANGYATVNIDASFGGVELYIPKEWTVVNDVTCTFAGSEEKGARGFQSYQNGDNTIVLKGNAKFSGISIYRV